jgi:hypothetical protein
VPEKSSCRPRRRRLWAIRTTTVLVAEAGGRAWSSGDDLVVTTRPSRRSIPSPPWGDAVSIMWTWIVLGVVAVSAGVYAFWPRAGGLDSRVNRASGIAHGRAGNYSGTSGPNNSGADGGGGL